MNPKNELFFKLNRKYPRTSRLIYGHIVGVLVSGVVKDSLLISGSQALNLSFSFGTTQIVNFVYHIALRTQNEYFKYYSVALYQNKWSALIRLPQRVHAHS